MDVYFHAASKRWKQINVECPKCGGAGGRWYSSGATWRGGMGTASCEWDVCDQCWGSGDTTKPWTDIRKIEAEESERIKQGVADWSARRMGADLSGMAPAIAELADELVKLSKSRKPRSPWFHLAAEMVA